MASIIFDISVAGNDPWELLYLAGGDPLTTEYAQVTKILTNNTVTQAALNQAAVDMAAGIKSAVAQQRLNSTQEDAITTTDIALAVLGDATSILKLQTLVGTTAPTVAAVLPAASSGGTTVKHNITATVAPLPTDDSTLGYSVGSLWVDTSTGASFICLDSTATASVWYSLTHTPASSVGSSTVTVEMGYLVDHVPPAVIDLPTEKLARKVSIRNAFNTATRTPVLSKGYGMAYSQPAIDDLNTRLYLASSIKAIFVYVRDVAGVMQEIARRDASSVLKDMQKKNNVEMAALYTAETAIDAATTQAAVLAVPYTAGIA